MGLNKKIERMLDLMDLLDDKQEEMLELADSGNFSIDELAIKYGFKDNDELAYIQTFKSVIDMHIVRVITRDARLKVSILWTRNFSSYNFYHYILKYASFY